MLRIILSIIFTSWGIIVSCQYPVALNTRNIRANNINDVHGLSSNRVNCIYRDIFGFIWFGTDNGLNRYDGNSFTVYKHYPNDTTSISNNYISDITGDGKGNIWIGTYDGLNKFEWGSNSFSRYSISEGLYDKKIISLLISSQGKLFVGTRYGLNILNTNIDKFIQVPNINEKNIEIVSLAEHGGRIYAGSYARGLFSYNKEINLVEQEKTGKKKHLTISDISFTPDGSLLLATFSGLYSFTPGSENIELVHAHLDNMGVEHIEFDNNGKLWLAKERELYTFDVASGSLLAINILDNKASEQEDVINDIHIDTSGIIWLATWSNGVTFYKENNNNFYEYYHPIGRLANKKSYVRNITSDSSGRLWAGTFGNGIYLYDSNMEQNSNIRFNQEIPGDYITSMLPDKKGNMWIGGLNGLVLFDINKKKVIKKFSVKDGLMHNEILYIYKDTRDSLWIATREGLNIYLPSQDIIKEFSRLRDLPHYKVYQVLEDHENNIWLATEKGLSRFDPIKGTIKSFFKPTSTNKSGISDNFIKSLLLDSDHNLWIGTGNGLNRYDYQTGEFNMFFEPDGLIHNVIGSINEDKQKNIWIQTYTGVSVYDKSTKLFKNFDESNGLRINSTANHVDKNGVFYYGEQHNGLYAFYPDSISSSTPAPPIYITSIESSGREVSVDPTRPGLLYKINPGEKYVKFNYTALSYMSKENNRFTYILEGFEEEWKSFGTQNTEAYYSKLPPGNYTFKVKHYNQDKTVPMGDMVSIRVLPRWWKTGWAFTLYFLLLAFLVVLFRMIKIRRARLIEYYSRERQRIQLEQKHDQLRLRLITNIVHEFRTPLTLILGISEKIIDHVRGIPEATRDKKILNNNITRINRLLEQLIDLRKIDNNAFRLKVFHYNLKDEVTDVFDSFKILAEKNKFTYHYKAHENDDETWFDKDIVEKVLYNLLSNAFKYTPEVTF